MPVDVSENNNMSFNSSSVKLFIRDKIYLFKNMSYIFVKNTKRSVQQLYKLEQQWI